MSEAIRLQAVWIMATRPINAGLGDDGQHILSDREKRIKSNCFQHILYWYVVNIRSIL